MTNVAKVKNACKARISPAAVVNTTIRARGNSCRIASIASMPLTFGILISIKVTSRRCTRNCASARYAFYFAGLACRDSPVGREGRLTESLGFDQ
jgi:hypothetical protein